MEYNEIKNKVKGFILSEFLPGENPDELTDKVALIGDGILDSVASLNLVAHLEESFDIEIDPHEVGADHFDSLDLITKLVVQKLG